MISAANSSIVELYKWTVNNRLSLNAEKTSALLFTNRPMSIESPLLLSVNGAPVFFDDSFKFLGMTIGSKLNFAKHIALICSKLSKTAGILSRVCSFVPLNILINLYYALCYPYLIYGVLVWGDTAAVHLNPLSVIQKKILRIITLSHYCAPSMPLFKKTNILNLADVFKLQLGVYMYKMKASGRMSYPQHSYATRYCDNAVSSFQRLTHCQKSLSYNGPKLWNSLPISLRDCNSINVFKREYRKYLLGQYCNDD